MRPAWTTCSTTCWPGARTSRAPGRRTPARAWTTRSASLLHQDPFTYRAFAKPRGYAGDAVMMDYIYGLGRGAAGGAQTPRRSAARSSATWSTRPSARAVRYPPLPDCGPDRPRRRAGRGPRARARRRSPSRGRDLSARSGIGHVQEFVAIDQDEASLAVVARDYARFGRHGARRLGPADSVGQGEPGPVRLRLRGRPVRLSQRAGRHRAHAPDVRDDAAGRGDADPELPGERSRSRVHGIVHGLAADLPRPRRHARAGRGASRSDVADCRVFDDGDDAITFLLVAKAGGRPGSSEIISDVLTRRR